MGLRLRCGEVSDFAGEQNPGLEAKINALEVLLRDLRRFADEWAFKGAGWDSAKALIRQVLVPLVKLQIWRGESLMRANSKMVALMGAHLPGDEELDEDGLVHDVERLRRLRRQVLETIPNAAVALQRQYAEQIQALEDKIGRLRAFDESVKGLYGEADSCTQQVRRALTALGSHGWGWDGKTGRFTIAGISMDWADGVDEYWEKRERSYDKVAWYRKCFGMDRVQAELFAGFDQKFEVYAKERGWSAEKTQYEYLRLLASITYGGLMWEQAAGVHTAADRKKVFGAMGIGDTDYTLFVHAVTQQSNGWDSTGFNELPSYAVGFAHLVGALACIVKQQRDPLNPGSLTYGKATEGVQYVYHEGRIFSHKRTSYYREAATFAGDIASGSLPDKDIRADIDAINLGDVFSGDRQRPALDILGEYYNGVRRGEVNRVDRFLRHYGKEYMSEDDPEKGWRFIQDHVDGMAATAGTRFLAEKAAESKRQKAREGFLRFLREGEELRCRG